jgi:hypothetical protein
MKKQIVNQEILLFTNTSFAKRELCEKDEATNERKGSSADQLEKACWSGLLFEMLPGIFENEGRELYVWKVNQAVEFIRVVLGPAPTSFDYENSIDPHFFLQLFTYKM